MQRSNTLFQEYIEPKRYKFSPDEFNKKIALSKEENPISYNIRGNAYLSQGKFNEAISDYNQALKIKEDYCEAYRNRGDAYLSLGEFGKAMSDYQKVLALGYLSVDAYCKIGHIHYESADYSRAIHSYTQSLMLNPEGCAAPYLRNLLSKINIDTLHQDVKNQAVQGIACIGDITLINELVKKGANKSHAAYGAGKSLAYRTKENILRFIMSIDDQELRILLAQQAAIKHRTIDKNQLLADVALCKKLMKNLGLEFNQAHNLLTQPEKLASILISFASPEMQDMHTLLKTLIEKIETHQFVLDKGTPLPTNANVVSDTAFKVFKLARTALLSNSPNETDLRSSIENIRRILKEAEKPNALSNVFGFLGHIPWLSDPLTITFYSHLLDEMHKVIPEQRSNNIDSRVTASYTHSDKTGEENRLNYAGLYKL
jgi:tetratricopeptide (TPR) repeat protein